MLRCPKCGNETTEEMAFCPKCGASLRNEQVPSSRASPPHYRNEKTEKEEKHEKNEKREKHEKGEHARTRALLIGGLVLIFLGTTSLLERMGYMNNMLSGAMFAIVVGAAIIIGALYGAVLASRRHPRT